MNNVPQGKQFNLDEIFANLPTETETVVELPSKSKFYGNNNISVRPMTFEDEKSMVMAKKENADSLNTLLSRCVKGVAVQDILLMDKFVLILKLREISYGENYDVIIPCQNCGFDNKMTFNLSQLNMNKIEDDVTNPREIELPITKVTLQVRYPKVSDEVYLKDENSVYGNLWRFVISLNGSRDPVLISNFIKDPRLPLKDIHVLIKEITGVQYGVDTKVKYECNSCKVVSLTNLPLGSDFFTVS
jgi:hypothetical protein